MKHGFEVFQTKSCNFAYLYIYSCYFTLDLHYFLFSVQEKGAE